MASSDLQKPELEHPKPSRVRRAYKSPAFSRFGRVSGLTMGSGGMGNDGSLGMTKMSDRAAKHNIIRLATLPIGIGLYLFDYHDELRELAGHGRQLGVMADEVEGVMPQAVSLHPSGYRMVDYAKLDIKSGDIVAAFLND
jgi:hypothetical protein